MPRALRVLPLLPPRRRVEVCRRCERRAQQAGTLRDSLRGWLRRRLWRRGRGLRVEVRPVDCLYQCPLDRVSVRLDGDPRDPARGEIRLFHPHDREKLAGWIEAALDGGEG